jgi:prepilin-type N-terminal cleavage/methylation domain-containing protein
MRRQQRRSGFTLVELLVVVGIIGLLIGILLPSLSGARVAAKNAKTKAQFQSLQQALEMFRNDVGEYPDSTKRADPTENAQLITDTASPNDPTPNGYAPTDAQLYGAQWLIRGLMGKDLRGYVNPTKARKVAYDNPATWYDFQGATFVEGLGPRETLYLSAEKLPVERVSQITGGVKPPDVTAALDDFQAHALLDAFERPILYYRADPRGRNKVLCDSASGDVDDDAPIPYYRLSENEIFTGNNDTAVQGWKFATGPHPLEFLGDVLDPDQVTGPAIAAGVTSTFAKFIHDHRVGVTPGPNGQEGPHVRAQPYNPDTYILISAGKDGLYGTEDDIKNFGDR